MSNLWTHRDTCAILATMIIASGSQWIYVGNTNKNDCPNGVVHTVVDVSMEGVITWSNFTRDDGTEGWTWHGEREYFYKFFRPVLNTGKKKKS